MNEVHEEISGNHIIRIFQDTDAESPRDWDNVTQMWCWHGRYNLGDFSDRPNCDPMHEADVRSYIKSQGDEVIAIEPLYLYDHSGITISTSPFSCRWDSGQVGYVFITRSTILKEFQRKRISKKLREWAAKAIQGEVKTYDQYLTGEVYGYELREVKDSKFKGESIDSSDWDNAEFIDSCWGFFDSPEEVAKEAQSMM